MTGHLARSGMEAGMGDIKPPSGAAETPTAAQREYLSDDPRDIGWVKQNVPCQTACPAGTNVPVYIREIIERQFGRSYETNREANVLPGVLGRICSRPCEAQCRHGWPGNGEPVAICHLKRVASDLKDAGHRITERLYSPTGKRVAIVGAGPAGVAAAHDLSLLGHDVVIFEREERPGGMLRYGIPEFRLPRDTLDIELHNALRLGVQMRTGAEIGNGARADPDGEAGAGLRRRAARHRLHGGFALAAAGRLGKARSARPGGRGIRPDFLVQMHRGEKKVVGKRVAVVGAGFTALDCARVAARLGAQEVTIHIRTAEEYIPVTQEEIFEAKREGVRIKGLRTPVGLTVEGNRLTGIEFVQNRLGGWRAGGRRQAIPIEGSEFHEPCDTIIIAIGQQTVNDFLGTGLELDRWGNVRVGEDGMTSVKGLFAAGDYVNGASTVIQAVGHGRKVARRIDAWLMGRERRKQVVRIVPVEQPLRERAFDFIPRQHMPTAPDGRYA
jgi:glutamate synthase (NADPH/NADH) small chain